MAIGKFLKTGGIAALAMGLALAAVPSAMAQDQQGRGGWRGGDRGQAAQQAPRGGGERSSGERRGSGGEWRNRGPSNGGSAPGWRGRQPQTVPQATAPAASPASPQRATPDQRRSWQGGRDWRSGNPQAQPPRNGVEQRQPQARDAAQQSGRQGGWQNRNSWRDGVGQDRRGNDGRDPRWNDNNRRDGTPGWRGDGNRNDGRWNNDRRNDNRWNNDRRNDNRWGNDRRNDRRWDNSWRNDRRYDWRGYRNTNRNVYRIGRYYAPYRNYYYRPLSIGFRLDSMFYGNSYWLNDPWQYRLPPADGGYRWVRYYDDVLLVDTYSGEVVDVIRDFFW